LVSKFPNIFFPRPRFINFTYTCNISSIYCMKWIPDHKKKNLSSIPHEIRNSEFTKRNTGKPKLTKIKIQQNFQIH
jgi:hypothetical protein